MNTLQARDLIRAHTRWGRRWVTCEATCVRHVLVDGEPLAAALGLNDPHGWDTPLPDARSGSLTLTQGAGPTRQVITGTITRTPHTVTWSQWKHRGTSIKSPSPRTVALVFDAVAYDQALAQGDHATHPCTTHMRVRRPGATWWPSARRRSREGGIDFLYATLVGDESQTGNVAPFLHDLRATQHALTSLTVIHPVDHDQFLTRLRQVAASEHAPRLPEPTLNTIHHLTAHPGE